MGGIHHGRSQTHVCFSRCVFVGGYHQASLAEMRLYWTEQKEAGCRFWNEKQPWFTFLSREREREKPQDPQKGLEKSHFGSVRCTNSEAELSSIVYTQVVKLSRLF